MSLTRPLRILVYSLVPVGISLGILGFFVFKNQPFARSKIMDIGLNKSASSLGYSACDVTTDTIYVRIKLAVDYPATAKLGDAFLVKAHVIDVDTESIKRESRCPDRVKDIRPSSEERQLAPRLLDESHPGIVLSLAGAEVKPEAIALRSDSIARWSVYPKQPGFLQGFLSIEAKASQPQQWYSPEPIHVATIGDTSVQVNVVEGFFTRDRIIAGVTQFGGPLLTLPGIVTFVREYRRRKKRLKPPSGG